MTFRVYSIEEKQADSEIEEPFNQCVYSSKI